MAGAPRWRAPRARGLARALSASGSPRSARRCGAAARDARLGLPASHRTDASAASALLALHARLAEPGGLDVRICRSLSPPPPRSPRSSASSALYFLLRVTPPRPRRADFSARAPADRPRPARQTTAFRTPWPLLLLRLAIAALVILAMAGPIWRAVGRRRRRKGPLLIVLDDGWAGGAELGAAHRARARSADGGGRARAARWRWLRFRRAGRRSRRRRRAPSRARLAALRPPPMRRRARRRRRRSSRFLAAHPDAETLWIADGLDLGGGAAFAARARRPFRRRSRPTRDNAARAGRRRKPARRARGHASPAPTRDAPARGHRARLRRARPQRRRGAVRFRRQDHRQGAVRTAGGSCATTSPGSRSTASARPAPSGWSTSAPSAGAWRSSPAAAPISRSRCSRPTYYITRALAPFADVREAKPGAADPIADLLAEQPSALALADMSVARRPRSRQDRRLRRGRRRADPLRRRAAWPARTTI